ncbi:hypothetical protein [Flexithrix dorotheae]|uniref:hypothetical protein n=1 Tax=Flexithrix dorotheae TaxID=70993 RepID=UPI0003635412|nr:hypothetical protein [Flexithrix dorotheae]
MQAQANKLLRTSKLIMVTPNNNNKFYEMIENEDGTFTTNYGRIGSRSSSQIYPVNLWDTKYREKIRKGYKDQTHLFATTSKKVDFEDISDEQVRSLISSLMQFATKSIQYNYNVNPDQVTETQLEEAQLIIDDLLKKVEPNMNTEHFNARLLELYQVIPRKMGNVKDHLVEKVNSTEEVAEINEMLLEEQQTLDVMRGQVQINSQKKEATEKNEKINLLEAMGLMVSKVEDRKVEKQIQKLMEGEKSKFFAAYEVKNIRTQQKFNESLRERKNKQTKLFWHGSRNENWMSILENGLVLRPSNVVITGKMFGYGLYFADRFKKSLNYTSLRGSYWTAGNSERSFLALYEVHTGNQFKVKKHQPEHYNFNEKKLKEKGQNYDSLFAKGGADLINNEYIVYNESQCTIKYLVEVRH